jgi:hypothetical protein
VTLTTRTYRKPDAALVANFDPDVRMLNALLVTPARPQWSLLTRDSLLCGYLGDARTIDFYETELPKHLPRIVERQSVEGDVALRARLWRAAQGNGSFAFRAAVAPSKIRSFVDAAQITRWVADAAFGVILGSIAVAHQSALLITAEEAGASIVLLDDYGHPVNPSPDPPVQALLERLKKSLDPNHRLRPLPVPAPISGDE